MAITISDTEPRVQYTATSGQTSFSVPFEFFTTSDIKVYNGTTLLTYAASPSSGSYYSVTGAGVSGGGSITLGSGGATLDDTITIYRDLGVARSTDFPTSGAFQVDSLNTELDKIIAMIQQVERDLKFSPKAAATTSSTYNLTFPDLVADKILSVNSAGTALEFLNTTTDVSAVAGVVDEIALLGVADVITDMGLLGTSAVIADMALLGTSDCVADMAILGTSDVVSDLNTLATSAIVTDMDLLATSANVTAMGLLGTSDVVTDMGLLGTSACVANMALLGTSDCVADMALLGTSACVADMALLGTSDCVADMALLGTSACVADMAILGTADVVSDMNTLASSDIVSDLNTLATSDIVTDLSTVADNIAGVSSFAARYRVASSEPGSDNDEGDLYYNTTANTLNYYDGSSWSAITADTDVKAGVSSNDTTPDYLLNKFTAGTAITIVETNDGGDETLTINATDPTALAIALG
jgi:carbonic anhydrase/acetyltransferase-like protein (isoleucine patch superfamily)|tara:strand:- start:18 stop:1433 length:1416 start_codon:yes stop_codon:yes gene_type:complete